ncbi:MAG: hypothetical protein R3A13_12100 [Bdellovibrionota bacterium]
MIDKLYPQLAPWVSLGFAAFIFVLYFTAKRLLNKTTLVSAPMIATFVAAISFHAIYLNLWPKDFSVELGLISLALIAVLKRIGIDTKRFELAFACLWIIVGIEFLVSLGAGRAENFHFMFTNLAFVGLIAYAYSKQKNEGSSFWLLVFASMQSLCALNRISELLVSRTIQDYFTSGLWGIFALLLLTLGFSKRDGMLAKCAVFILWLVSAKVLFLDLSGSSQIVRIITLCLVGAIIYAGGLILKRFKQLEA